MKFFSRKKRPPLKEMVPRIFSVAKKEFRLNIHNRWIILLVLVFIALTVLVSFYGTASSGEDEWRGLRQSVLWMSTYMEYMVPIFGLILGYSAVVRERESGSLGLLLSYPLDRGEVLAGKFLGLWCVLAACISSGLFIGGLIVSTQVGYAIWADYYLFVLSSVILGGVYLSISLLISIIFEDTISAMSASIFVLFLFSFLWLVGVYAIAELTFGWSMISEGSVPRWYFGLQFFNPVIIWFTLLALNIAPFQDWAMEFGGREPRTTPGFYDTWVMIVILLVWMAVPLLLAEFIFNRQDID